MVNRRKGEKRVALTLFQAFADQTRLRILRVLRDGEMCVGDLIQIISVPQPTVSRHLAHLRRAGLVAARKEGPWVFYSLTSARSPLHKQMVICLDLCLNEIPELREDARAAGQQRLHGGCCPHSPHSP